MDIYFLLYFNTGRESFGERSLAKNVDGTIAFSIKERSDSGLKNKFPHVDIYGKLAILSLVVFGLLWAIMTK
jgi:hypothetical protein